MTEIDRAELRKLAEAATPGPWHSSAPPDDYVEIVGADGTHVCGDVDRREHTLYLQAANPATVLALLDEIERLQEFRASALELSERDLAYMEELRRQRDEARAETKHLREQLRAAEGPPSILERHTTAVRANVELAERAKRLERERDDARAEVARRRALLAKYVPAEGEDQQQVEPEPDVACSPPLLEKLTALVNEESREDESDTPDWVLARVMWDALRSFEQATNEREAWYGRKTKPAEGEEAPTDSPPTPDL